MTLAPVVLSLGTVPFFATRIFLTSFLLCLFAFLQRTGDLDFLRLGPLSFDVELYDWMANPVLLWTFGALAVAEMLAEQNSDLRTLFEAVDGPFKTAGTAIVQSGVRVTPALAAGASAGAGLSLAAFEWTALWVAVPAALVWLTAALRTSVWRFVDELDPGDDFGLQTILSWSENAWVLTGMLCFVILPSLALAIAGATFVLLFALSRYAAHREAQLKRPCGACGHPNHGSALYCGSCRRRLADARAIGLFGQPIESQPAGDVRAHQLRLALKKRCPVCATRLPKDAVQQKCPSCRTTVFSSLETANAYLDSVDRKLPKTLLISAVLSAVPLLGLAPGIIYYRMSLIAGLRGYTPALRNFALRWAMRLVMVSLLAFQWVPGFGALCLPLMCWLSYRLYRGTFVRERDRLFAVSAAS